MNLLLCFLIGMLIGFVTRGLVLTKVNGDLIVRKKDDAHVELLLRVSEHDIYEICKNRNICSFKIIKEDNKDV